MSRNSPLFGIQADGCHYDAIRKELKKQLGSKAPVCHFLKENRKWMQRIIKMRNASEHPGGWSGTLSISNIEAVKDQAGNTILNEPGWSLDGKQPFSIASFMCTAVENMLSFAEDLLVVSFVQLHPKSIIAFAEIPEMERDPRCPIRLRAISKERCCK
jgi:hypothetical protein